MYSSKLIIGIVLSIAVLATVSFLPQIEAKPISSKTLWNGVDFSCSANNGNLSCSMKSSSGGKIGDASMMIPDSGSPIICDEDTHEKKRLSVTTRNSINCTHSFIQGSAMRLVVRYVDGVDTESIPIGERPILCIANVDNGLSFVQSYQPDCS